MRKMILAALLAIGALVPLSGAMAGAPIGAGQAQPIVATPTPGPTPTPIMFGLFTNCGLKPKCQGPAIRPQTVQAFPAFLNHFLDVFMFFGGSIADNAIFNWNNVGSASYNAFNQIDPVTLLPHPAMVLDTLGGCELAVPNSITNYNQIANGDYDAQITSNALQRLAAYNYWSTHATTPNAGVTVVRWCWEWNIKTVNITAPQFIAAFQHIVTVSRAAGDIHTLWFYCPAGTKAPPGSLDGYPGDTFADIVGFDAYNFDAQGPFPPGGTPGITGFLSIIGPEYDAYVHAATHCGDTHGAGCISATKPIWVGETASGCGNAAAGVNDQDVYVTGATQGKSSAPDGTNIRTRMNRLAEITWFDANKAAGAFNFLGPSTPQCTQSLINLKAFVTP